MRRTQQGRRGTGGHGSGRCRCWARPVGYRLGQLALRRRGVRAQHRIALEQGHDQRAEQPGAAGRRRVFARPPPLWASERAAGEVGDQLRRRGVEADNVEHAANDLFIHQTILKTNRTLLIENLCNLERIGVERFTLCALPLYTTNADGAPTRVIALTE